jgi:beta-lactamase class A
MSRNMMLSHLSTVDTRVEDGSIVSIWCAPLGSTEPSYARDEHVTHYAASTMKIALLATLFRLYDAGIVDIDKHVRVVNDFESAKPGAPPYSLVSWDDNDQEVWSWLGTTAPLRWIARRMIVASGNLAANIVLSHIGAAAVAKTMALAGATDGRVERGIADAAARDAGIDNQLSARDLAMLLNRVASTPRSTEMLEILCAQERREDLAAGLPPDTRLAHKNGFVRGVRHAAGIVLPADAPPYVIAVCTTNPVVADRIADSETDRAAASLIAQIAAASWSDRHEIGRTQ